MPDTPLVAALEEALEIAWEQENFGEMARLEDAWFQADAGLADADY